MSNNSAEPKKMSHSAVSGLILHSLPLPHEPDESVIWINAHFIDYVIVIKFCRIRVYKD